MTELGSSFVLLLASLFLLFLALATRITLARISYVLRSVNSAERAQERAVRMILDDVAAIRSDITGLQAQWRDGHSPMVSVSERLLTNLEEVISQSTSLTTSLTDRLNDLSRDSQSGLEALADWQRSHTNHLTTLAGKLNALSDELRELREEYRAISAAPPTALTELREVQTAQQALLDAVNTRLDLLSAQPAQFAEHSPIRPAESGQRVAPAEIANGEVSAEQSSSALTPAGSSPSAPTARSIGEQVANRPGLRPPADRGGRPRGPSGPAEIRHERQSEVPELICRKRMGHWILAVHVPAGLPHGPEATILQDSSPLARDDYDESLWLLASIRGTISFPASRLPEIVLDSSGTLTFKLSRDCTEGRRVRSLTSGLYLVLVPDDWSLDERAGPRPFAAEPVAMPGVCALVFDLEGREAGALRWLTEAGQPAATLPVRARRFSLVGHRLNDNTPHMGPLFGGSPPGIAATGDNGWHDVDLIVIGAEGPGPGRWRTAYAPDPHQAAQDLSPVTTAGGWYFLRFYNREHQLIDSMDFRFLRGLTEIRYPTDLLYPGEEGHEPIDLEFVHDNTCVAKPAGESRPIGVISVRTHDGSVAKLPPDPACDTTNWHLSSSAGGNISVTVRLRRVWWALGDEDASGPPWSATRVSCRLQDFEPTSGTVLSLLGLAPDEYCRSVVQLELGSTTRQAHFFGDLARVRLREFCDAPELQEPGVIQLRLHVEQPDTMPSICVAELLIRVRCGRCESLSNTYDLLLEHIAESHLDELLPPLTYEETYALLRESSPSLPSAIYRCSHCRFYAQADDPLNPTSVICNHIEHAHRHADLRFHVIRDVQEVRANVIQDVPEIRRCSLCSEHFTSPTLRGMMEHLRQHPRREFGELS